MREIINTDEGQATKDGRAFWVPRSGPSSVVRHAVSIAIAVIFVIPLVWLVSASLRQPGLPPPRVIEWIPNPVSWVNYATIFDMLPLGRYTLNSLLVTALAVP